MRTSEGEGARDARKRHEARDDARTCGQTVRTECDDATRNKEEEETILIGHGVQQARTANASGLAAGGFAAVNPLLSRLIPMSAMFYCMAFANSILDALKDTLVVTAIGGNSRFRI